MSLWTLRIFFLLLCTLGGYAVSQVRPELIHHGVFGLLIGFGLGALLVGLDEMLRGFSLRNFSAASFGLLLGALLGWLVDQSGLFDYVEEKTRWMMRLALFLGFGYLGMVLALRSNKEDFYLIIPFVRFASQSKAENFLLLDTSAIIDGRVADLIETKFLEGTVVVPRFVLHELQHVADASDPVRRARGRRGLEVLERLRNHPQVEVKIHEADVPEEQQVDAKLVRLARMLDARLITNDFNLAKIAALQSVRCLNVSELAAALRPRLAPGDVVSLRLVREGRERGQAVGYLGDGTMVVVNQAHRAIGQQVEVRVQGLHQTGAGVIVFAELCAGLP